MRILDFADGFTSASSPTITGLPASSVSVSAIVGLTATDAQSAFAELVSDLNAKASTSALTAHTSATSAHGVTGNIVGTSDTQTLTNKTIVAASNTITTAASGGLTATDLNSALAQLETQITVNQPMTAVGDTIYGGTAGAVTKLLGNTTTTKKFLTQTGTGTVSAAPSWNSIVAGDVPTLNQNTTGTAANITGTSNSTLTTLSALSLPASQLTGLIAATGATATPTASTIAEWDANKNLSANNLIDGYTTTVTAASSTTLTASSTYQQYFTGSTTQAVIMPAASTLVLGQQFYIANLSSGAVAVQSSGFNIIQSMAQNTQLTLTCVAISGSTAAAWQTSYSLLSNATAGSGSTGLNYLSAYTPSLSSGVQNSGNGDFELGTTVGFGLGHITGLTNGLPTSSSTVTFGSGASGNLSFTATNTNALSQKWSANLVSSAATTVGDMLHTDAFFINASDQVKVLQFKFNYKISSGTLNLSGTSANSLAVAIYDVTAAAFISVNNPFAFTQSGGVGQVIGTFQSSATSTQYRLIVYNVNATSGAAAIEFDDFSVGPATVNIQTPTIDFIGVPTSQAVTASVTNLILTTTKDTTNSWSSATFTVPVAGDYLVSGCATASAAFTIQPYKNGVATAGFFASAASGGAPSAGVVLIPNCVPGDTITFRSTTSVSLNVAGSLSILCVSNMTVAPANSNVASRAHIGTAVSTTAGSPFNFDTIDFDSTASITTGASNWKYTVQSAGTYKVDTAIYAGGTSCNMQLFKNGSAFCVLGRSVAGTGFSPGSTLINCVPGDAISIVPDATITPSALTTVAATNWVSISLVSTAATAANNNVSVSLVVNTSTTVGTTSQNFIYTNKIKDSFNIYSTVTGKATIPISGTYSFVCAAGASSYTSGVIGNLRQNGTIIVAGLNIGNTAEGTVYVAGSWPFNAGDLVDFIPSTAFTANGSATSGYFMLSRTGN